MAEAFTHPIQVRYLEVDQQGVVFNMWYLAYFDDAMTAFLARNGLPYTEMTSQGYDVQLVHTDIDWRGGVGFGDDVRIKVELAKLGNTSFTLAFEVLRAAEPVVNATIVYVCIGLEDGQKKPLPQLLKRGIGAVD